MKKLLFLFLLTLCLSCESSITCSEPDPKPPYGIPDEIAVYDGTYGYRAITYIYYCKSGKYIDVTYSRLDACTKYEKSEFVTSGICP